MLTYWYIFWYVFEKNYNSKNIRNRYEMKINQSVFGNFWKIRQGFFLKLNKPHENEKWLEIFEIREDLNWLQTLKKCLDNQQQWVPWVRNETKTFPFLTSHHNKVKDMAGGTYIFFYLIYHIKMVWVITHQIRFIRFEKNYNSKNIRK